MVSGRLHEMAGKRAGRGVQRASVSEFPAKVPRTLSACLQHNSHEVYTRVTRGAKPARSRSRILSK